jgi:nucleotide-binding universal stress UspA family protein
VSGDPEIVRRPHGEETHETILRSAREMGAVAVGLATGGQGWMRHMFMGSTAMSLLRAADLPLLLAGGATEAPLFGPGFRLLFTTDGSPASEAALATLLPLIEAGPLPVTLWRAMAPGDAGDEAGARARLAQLAESLPPGAEHESVVETAPHTKDVAGLATARAQEAGASAIAMATHGFSARYQLLAGSVAMEVLKRSPVPVLVVRAREEIVPRL